MEFSFLVARFSIRNALGLEWLDDGRVDGHGELLDPYFDNTKFFLGGIVARVLWFTGFVDF